jgi:hypothetical protein
VLTGRPGGVGSPRLADIVKVVLGRLGGVGRSGDQATQVAGNQLAKAV